ncbi:MAG: PilZ domain-containing protein [Bryobacteraceae bacterium]|nr:PilZ domain-containing protein [Bryobacteraceae bacterium]MCX7603228.1 PilZ domain-containing protein [Bryobacteraceae bacterium]
MSGNCQERRREPRQPASGPVTLELLDVLPRRVIEGRLVDISPSGFRASHGYAGLTSGQRVRFEYPGRRGEARVAWTRVAGKEVESGFFVLG